MMRADVDIRKIKELPTAEEMLVKEYGPKGTSSREEFDA